MEDILDLPQMKDFTNSDIYYLGLLSKEKRAWMCKSRSPEAEQVAAIEIQRFWRGSRVRFKIRALFESLLTELRAPSQQVLQSDDSSVSGQVHQSSSTQAAAAEQSGTPSLKSGSRRKARKSRNVSQLVGLQRVKKGQAETETAGKASESPVASGKEHSSQFQPETEKAGKAPESPAASGKERSSQFQPETEKAGKAPESPAASWKARNSLFLHTAFVKKKKVSCVRAAGKRQRKRDLEERALLEEQFGPLSSGEREVPVKSQRMTKKSAPRLALEATYDRYVQKALKKGVASAHMLQFAEYCAHKIQVWWLMKHRRFLRERFIQRLVELQKKAALESAAAMEAMIQGSSVSVQKKTRDRPPTEREAAISIQRAWRRHIDIQVYRYYRDLINFKTRGNPSVMLRCINPNEAKLLDPASGTSVRFRLAGDRFPPNIYYKIFTHRPIQDMGANSPKDYTKAQAKQLNVRHRHNNVAPIPPQQDDKGGWYERSENNGWRLVSDRLIHHILNDPISWESSKKTYQFHHSKLKRKQDVEKQKKTKKIDWMKKMYKQGMLRARADDQETVQLIEGAAAGMMATVDNQGPDALEDWEVDELLDWTTSLNFEEYFNTWKDLATSAAADNQLEKTMSISTSKSDPYELTVSTAPSRFQSTRQSRHTTATLTSGSVHVKT